MAYPGEIRQAVDSQGGYIGIKPYPELVTSAPTSSDKAIEGRIVYTSAGAVYMMTNASSGQWTNLSGGSGSFSSLTVSGTTTLNGPVLIDPSTAADTITIGSTAQTGALTVGRSTAGQDINIGSGVNAAAQVISIANGASADDSTVNVLSGVATAGTQTLNALNGASTSTGLAFNLMNGAGSGTRDITIAGGSALATTIGIGDGVLGNTITVGNGVNTVAQTVSIANGAAAADSTLNLFSGTATAGTQTLNIGNGEYAKAINIGNGALGNTILMGNGDNSVAQTVSIANGASAADSTVNILSGVGTAGAGVLNLANNTRVTTVDIGDIAPAAARTFNVAGGDQAQDDTFNILAGAPSAGTQTFNLLTGLATGGTQAANIATGGGAVKTVHIGNNVATSSVRINTAPNEGFEIADGAITPPKVIAGSTADPSAGGGVTAPQGSMYLSTAGGTGATLWVKYGANDTDWEAPTV